MKAKITRRGFLKAGGAGAVATAVIPGEDGSLRAAQTVNLTTGVRPDFEDYATIEAYADGVPVYSLGNIVFLYGVSPDVLPDVVMQNGNTNPKIKIKPKKSWDIKDNPFGATMPEPGPRTMWNDCEPALPIHLIDGDPNTMWCSFGSQIPDARAEWIRIDLPEETSVTAVVLVCSQDFAGTARWEAGKLRDRQEFHKWAGKALPNELTIQVSRDAWHWETVYESKTFSGNESGPAEIVAEPTPQNSNQPRFLEGLPGGTIIEFAAHRAKQILITGRNFKRRLDKYVGYAFSLGGVEVWDSKHRNLALISRGTGVTASSTAHLQDHDRLTQEILYEPLQYDLGLKYARVGADTGVYTWNYVERPMGTMKVDPIADQTVSNFHANGINVIMNLDVKAHFLYQGRKVDWKRARVYELNNIYYDFPGWCWDTPEMFEGYLRYVEFMVRHFKDRVAYFEIGNEWAGPSYVYSKTVFTIKKIYPQARIMVGVGRMSQFKGVLQQLIKEASPNDLRLLMPDAVGSHPNTQVDAGLTLDDLKNFYWEENRQAIKDCNALGYKGIYMASEVYSWVMYPPGPRALDPDEPRLSYYYGDSEMVRAKYVAQNLVGHAGLNMLAFVCNTYFTASSVGQSLLGVTVPSQTLTGAQPGSAYYTFRTLCTVLEGWKARDFPINFSGAGPFTVFTFQRGEGEMMVAATIPGDTTDGIVETASDVTVPKVRAKEAWVIDVLNGTEQKLTFNSNGEETTFKGILIKDYPTLIRMTK
jgi:hypothetical protein